MITMITMITEIKVVIVMRRAREVYSPFRSPASEAPPCLGLQVNLILHQYHWVNFHTAVGAKIKESKQFCI